MVSRHPSPRFLPADKRGWPQHVVHRMILGRLAKGFNRIRAQGLAELRAELDRDPSGVLLVSNHSCWWDLFLAHILSRSIPIDGHGMMEHGNVKRFWFFRRIGAFSIDRTSTAGIKASMDYTAGLLAKPRTGVWIFPQGKIESNDLRPILFERGLRTLLKRAGKLRVVPVALRYDFWQEERPECLVRFGLPFLAEDPSTVVSACEQAVTIELDRLREQALGQDESRFETILQGKMSVSERYARFAEKLRGRRPG